MALPRITDPVTLRGQHVQLVPLQASHAEALAEAVRDGELWQLWYTAVPTPEGMAAEISRRLGLQAARSMLPFTVLDAGGTPVGMTTYMNIDNANQRVEIGSTWYASRRAIERLGAQLDGMLRNHQRAGNGTLRDTAVYSITADEWPTVRAHLDFQRTREH